MLDRALRKVKDSALEPAALALGPGVPPNAVTLAAFALGAAAAALLLHRRYLPALALWLLSRILDGLDGALARAHGRQSDFGGYLDILCDFVLYSAIPIALALGRPPPRPLPELALLLASFYVNAASWMYLAALLEKRAIGAATGGEETSVTMPSGIVEGTETILLFSLYILFPAALGPLFLITAALVTLTALQRLAWSARHLR